MTNRGTMDTLIKNKPVLVLRKPKPVPKPGHQCVVKHGEGASLKDNYAIIQCVCGKRYRCRISYVWDSHWVWVRRLLPWPPKQQDFPNGKDN